MYVNQQEEAYELKIILIENKNINISHVVFQNAVQRFDFCFGLQ